MTASQGLSVRNVTRRFDGHIAVDNVSFDVGPGELVALVGASGSGKTTSLRLVAGYDIPTSGSVWFNDSDITRLPPEKRGFGMVFQHYALFPHMSVAENVAFGLEARGVGRQERMRRANVVLESVGLSGKGDRRIQQLSGGEQQRVALARAIVIEPNVLLLDEPLSNLDPTLRESTRDELRAMLRRVGAPALFVTHDQEDAFAIADRIVLLAKGRVLQSGTPEEIYFHPASRGVATFIGRATLIPAQDQGAYATVNVNGISRTLPVTRTPGSEERFTTGSVVLRPESLALTHIDTPDVWPGTIVRQRFTGAAQMYQVSVSDDIIVEVLSEEHHAVGDRVGVAIRRLPVHIVP
jgi:ABC-type Fe3+/spermidine/putrescine transport system ATPase subunit